MNMLKSWRFTNWLLVLLPVSLLAGTWHLSAGPVPLYPFELIGLVLVVFLSPSLAQIKYLLPKAGWLAVGLLLVGLVCAVLIAGDRMEALGALKSWFILPMIFAAVIAASKTCRTPLLVGIVLFALGQTVLGWYLLPDQVEPRLMGTFASPNFYAACVVPALFLLLSHLRKQPVIFTILSAVLLVGLVMSQSLGGFLAVGVAGVVWAISLTRGRSRGVAVVGLVVLLLIGGSIARQRFAHIQESSLVSRLQIWHTAVVIGEEHPVLGIGLRGFGQAYEETVGRVVGVPIEWGAPEPHNIFLALWLNLGLLGAAGMIGLVAISLRTRHYFPAVLAICAVVGHGLVDTPFFKLELAVLFWLYLSLLLWQPEAAA